MALLPLTAGLTKDALKRAPNLRLRRGICRQWRGLGKAESWATARPSSQTQTFVNAVAVTARPVINNFPSRLMVARGFVRASIVRSIRQRDLLNTWLRLYDREQRLPRPKLRAVIARDLFHRAAERLAGDDVIEFG